MADEMNTCRDCGKEGFECECKPDDDIPLSGTSLDDHPSGWDDLEDIGSGVDGLMNPK